MEDNAKGLKRFGSVRDDRESYRVFKKWVKTYIFFKDIKGTHKP